MELSSQLNALATLPLYELIREGANGSQNWSRHGGLYRNQTPAMQPLASVFLKWHFILNLFSYR